MDDGRLRDGSTDPWCDLLHTLVTHSPDGMVVVDADGTLRYANPWADQMLGYVPGQTVGRNVFEMVHPDDQVSALEGFDSTISSRRSRPLPLLIRLRRADGSWLQTELIGTNHLENEHIRGLLVNIRDVERSMRTEEALRESEAHHRLIVELAHEGIWTVDDEGRTTFANRAMAAMLDTTVTEMLDTTIFDFMDGDADFDAHETLDRRNHGTTEEHDLRLVTQSGRTVWTRMHTSPIVDHNGKSRGAIALVTDITERRILEQRLTADARQDALTGLANRITLFEALTKKLDGSRVVTGLYIDLDGFKQVNDSFGHAMGDEVLRTVAARLCSAVRTGDVVARMGGDEFVVISDALANPEEAIVLGRRIRDVLARVVSYGGIEIPIDACVGIALAIDTDPDTLLSEADRALYRAKHSGRGRVELNPAVLQPLRAAGTALFTGIETHRRLPSVP